MRFVLFCVHFECDFILEFWNLSSHFYLKFKQKNSILLQNSCHQIESNEKDTNQWWIYIDKFWTRPKPNFLHFFIIMQLLGKSGRIIGWRLPTLGLAYLLEILGPSLIIKSAKTHQNKMNRISENLDWKTTCFFTFARCKWGFIFNMIIDLSFSLWHFSQTSHRFTHISLEYHVSFFEGKGEGGSDFNFWNCVHTWRSVWMSL